MRKTKRLVIKEELIALTGKLNEAIVLNQMIYWSERIRDADKFVEEELQRARRFTDGNVESIEEMKETLKSGWIYKKSSEMIDECMLSISRKTMDRVFDCLVENGWLDKRKNPKYKWDRVWQYRVNLYKIQQDLFKLGYSLEGYTLPKTEKNTQFEQDDHTKGRNDHSKGQIDPLRGHGDHTKGHDVPAIPEITTKITNKVKEEKEGATDMLFLIQFYENNFGKIGDYILKKITFWCDVLSTEVVLEAMKLSIEYGGQKWSYVETVLVDWKDKNISTVQQAENAVKTFKKGKASSQQSQYRKSKGSRSKTIRTEMLPDWFVKQKEEEARKAIEQQEVEDDFDYEAEKRKLEEKLKKYRK